MHAYYFFLKQQTNLYTTTNPIGCSRISQLGMTHILTQRINEGSAICEPATGTQREIDAIRSIVGSSKRDKPIIVSVVNQRVAKDEETRNLSVNL